VTFKGHSSNANTLFSLRIYNLLRATVVIQSRVTCPCPTLIGRSSFVLGQRRLSSSRHLASENSHDVMFTSSRGDSAPS